MGVITINYSTITATGGSISNEDGKSLLSYQEATLPSSKDRKKFTMAAFVTLAVLFVMMIVAAAMYGYKQSAAMSTTSASSSLLRSSSRTGCNPDHFKCRNNKSF